MTFDYQFDCGPITKTERLLKLCFEISVINVGANTRNSRLRQFDFASRLHVDGLTLRMRTPSWIVEFRA